MQAALVTGGMMVLGAGVASAQDAPDAAPAAQPLDVSLSVPVRLCNNAIGTPIGQLDVPCIEQEIGISSEQILPPALSNGLGAGASQVSSAASPYLSKLPGAEKSGLLNGTTAGAHVVLPVDISGNAIAAGGPVHVKNESERHYGKHGSLTTSGAGGLASGTAAEANVVAPIQITGNAISAIGEASSDNKVYTTAEAGNDIKSDGTGGLASGTVIPINAVAPIQINGNAVSASPLGKATTHNDSRLVAKGGGDVSTSGTGGLASGLVADGPAALPISLNSNAVGGALGNAEVNSMSTNSAVAGGNTHSAGDKGLVSGIVARPAIAEPVGISGNSLAAAAGKAKVHGDQSTTAKAGGDISSSGNGGFASGIIADAPVTAPAQINGNALAAYLDSEAESKFKTNTDSKAGGDVWGDGSNSFLGGVIASTPVALPVTGAGNGVAYKGTANAESEVNNNVKAGGSKDTSGWNSVLGGLIADTPVALPVDALGNGAGYKGNANGKVSGSSSTTAGGFDNCIDDAGFGACNVAAVPVALPLHVDGNSANYKGTSTSDVEFDRKTTAGGPITATGKGGQLAGNVLTAPISGPVGVVGNAVAAQKGAEAQSWAKIKDTTNAGGDIHSDGSDGQGSGNVLQAPVGLGAGVIGNAVSGGVNPIQGHATAATDYENTNKAGGNIWTTGKGGQLSGNAGQTPVNALAQVFGNSVSGNGVARNDTRVRTNQTSGGNIDTDGQGGFISGNAGATPVAAVAQVFGNAVGGWDAESKADNETKTQTGGNIDTGGDNGIISGNAGQLAPNVLAQVFGNTATVGNGEVEALNKTSNTVGGSTVSTGKDSFLGGNVGAVPAGVAAQVFGNAVGGPRTDIKAPNRTSNTTLGKVESNGDGSFGGGNVGSVPVGLLAQVFGTSAAFGQSHIEAPNAIDNNVGGPGKTSGRDSFLGGNIGQLPVGAVAQVADTVLPLGDTHVNTPSLVKNNIGGDIATDGTGGTIAGNSGSLPVGLTAPVNDVLNSVPVFGRADILGKKVVDNNVGGAVNNSTQGGNLLTGAAANAGTGIDANNVLKGALGTVSGITGGTVGNTESTTKVGDTIADPLAVLGSDAIGGLVNNVLGGVTGAVPATNYGQNAGQHGGVAGGVLGAAEGIVDQVTGSVLGQNNIASGLVHQAVGFVNPVVGTAVGLVDQVTGSVLGQGNFVSGIVHQVLGGTPAQGEPSAGAGIGGLLENVVGGVLGGSGVLNGVLGGGLANGVLGGVTGGNEAGIAGQAMDTANQITQGALAATPGGSVVDQVLSNAVPSAIDAVPAADIATDIVGDSLGNIAGGGAHYYHA
ncbi:hypothetical protein D5S17_04130 [Pseudonocardiaceae bacterium YIM PH 21723]|nr:hypothetical protein D5S17_04130 [Pseudonocardiaceae bacterium YIM PH 21723]